MPLDDGTVVVILTGGGKGKRLAAPRPPPYLRPSPLHEMAMFRILTPPVFATDEQTRHARDFHTVAWATLGLATLFVTTFSLIPPVHIQRGAAIIGLATAFGLVALGLNRRGSTRAASWLFTVGITVIVSTAALSAGGIRAPGLLTGFTVVVMAGLLLGFRGAVTIASLWVLGGLALVLAEANGLLPAQTRPYSAAALWVAYAFFMALVIVLQRMATRNLSQALDSARNEVAERRVAERRLHQALDAGEIGIWELDRHTGMFKADARLYGWHGIPLNESRTLPLSTWMARVHPDDVARMENTLASLGTGAIESTWVDFRIVPPDGTVRHLEAAAAIVADPGTGQPLIVGSSLDVTARKHAEAERERLVHALGERVKELTLLHHATALLQSHRPLERGLLSRLVEKIPSAFQYPEHCAARIAYRDLDVTTSNWGPGRDTLTASFKTDAGEGVIEVVYLDRPGTAEDPFLAEERALLASLAEIVVSHARREAAEQQRRNVEGQLRQAQKMDALGTLAGGIAHDFNNILTAINGNAELGLGEVPPNHAAHEFLDEIARAGARAKTLVKRILVFSRKSDVERKTIALTPVVEEVVGLLRASLRKSVKIAVSCDPDLPEVLADSTQVHQVVMNLGTNGGHAMGERGGTLTIKAERVTIASHDSPSADLQPGPHARITVSDTGTGMSPEILGRIFEPFFTTKGQQGTGLGLSVVHGIIRDHQGAVTVESEVGKGTTFAIYLPASKEAAAQAAASATALVRGSGQHVMYVDDDESLLFVMTRVLERLGYRCTGFVGPHEALQAFRTSPGGFDAVIMDMSMPGMTGVDLARALRELRPDIPCALASGYPGDEGATALRAGIATLIPKPATVEEVGAALGRMLRAA